MRRVSGFYAGGRIGLFYFFVDARNSFLFCIVPVCTYYVCWQTLPSVHMKIGDIKEMPPNNLHKPVTEFTDFIRFILYKLRRLFSGSF